MNDESAVDREAAGWGHKRDSWRRQFDRDNPPEVDHVYRAATPEAE